MEITIASPPDREQLVAEVFFEHEQWAELNTESGDVALELYPRVSGEPWEFKFEDAVNALQAARTWLLNYDGSMWWWPSISEDQS